VWRSTSAAAANGVLQGGSVFVVVGNPSVIRIIDQLAFDSTSLISLSRVFLSESRNQVCELPSRCQRRSHFAATSSGAAAK
jgi:hypothetical protein